MTLDFGALGVAERVLKVQEQRALLFGDRIAHDGAIAQGLDATERAALFIQVEGRQAPPAVAVDDAL